MRAKHLYLIMAAVGALVPYYFFLTFLRTYGFDAREFTHQLFGTPIAAFFVTDLVIASVVFLIFMFRESARLSMRQRWVYALALFTVGLSFALPLFLYVRASRIDSGAGAKRSGE